MAALPFSRAEMGMGTPEFSRDPSRVGGNAGLPEGPDPQLLSAGRRKTELLLQKGREATPVPGSTGLRGPSGTPARGARPRRGPRRLRPVSQPHAKWARRCRGLICYRTRRIFRVLTWIWGIISPGASPRLRLAPAQSGRNSAVHLLGIATASQPRLSHGKLSDEGLHPDASSAVGRPPEGSAGNRSSGMTDTSGDLVVARPGARLLRRAS